jgi:hypothetical protein
LSKKNLPNYTVVVASTLDDLIDATNAMIKEGYLPIGNIVIFEHIDCLGQSMLKRKLN